MLRFCAYSIVVSVLEEELQCSSLEQFLSLHRGLVVLVSLGYGLAENILELVIRSEGLLWPAGKDVGVDFALKEKPLAKRLSRLHSIMSLLTDNERDMVN